MDKKQDLLAKIYQNETFKLFGVPLDSGFRSNSIKDATFYLRRDGLIVNAEGWYHPSGYLLGEVLYAPDFDGDKEICGQRYRKVTLFPGTYNPVPYAQRAAMLRQYESLLDQNTHNPYFAKYKQILPLTDFVATFPAERSLVTALNQMNNPNDELNWDLNNLQYLLGISSAKIQFGLTGTLALGQIQKYHDLDIMFLGSLEQNRQIAERMRELTKREVSRRCFEGGKAWSIRFFNDRNKLMCCFFGYKEKQDIPLDEFEMSVDAYNVGIEGTVYDDTHSMYTPTILQLEDVVLIKRDKVAVTNWHEERLTLVIYHTASRGDCYIGDRVQATGALVTIKSKGGFIKGLCVIEREGVRNLTPPWPNYYGKPEFC